MPSHRGEGDVTPAEAFAALEALEQNLASGLMPTTGGAVSLMGREHVDLLYDTNHDRVDGFAPLLPDTNDHVGGSRDEWYIAAIEQALFCGDTPFSSAHVHDMDAFLSTYRGTGVDWSRIHAYALSLDATVPRKWDVRYWSRDAEPLSILAFCSKAFRDGTEDDSETPTLAHREGEFGKAGRLEAQLEAAEARNRKLRLILLGTLAAVCALVTITFATARHWTKIDVPASSETYETGKYIVTDNGVNPCNIGESWSGCIDKMANEYNEACAGPKSWADEGLSTLTWASQSVCEEYGDSIDEMKSEGGAGRYVSSLGDFGYLERTPETSIRKAPAVTHKAICYLGFIGECE